MAWWNIEAPNYGPTADERRERLERMGPNEYQSWLDRGPKRHDCVEKPDCLDALKEVTDEQLASGMIDMVLAYRLHKEGR